MYKLFTQIHEENNSIIRPMMIDYILSVYKKDVLEVTNYRKTSVSSVKSNHLLCRLVQTGSVPKEYDIERFMAAAYARSPYISKHFRLTSAIDFGALHTNVFLPAGSKEILIYDETYFNPFEKDKQWKDICAVKVLYLEDSSMSLQLLDGNKHSTAANFGMFSINIPLLLYQYRCFQMDQIGKSIATNGELGDLDVGHFIKMYVLPNMLSSKIEFMILNRFMNIYYGKPMDEQLTNISLSSISDYREKLDREFRPIVKHVSDSRKMYYSVLKNIPCVFHKDMQEFLQMPDMSATRQVWWALFCCRLKIMKFLIDIGGEKALASNSFYISVLKADVKKLLSENVLEKAFGADLAYGYLEIISDIKKL